MSDQNSEVTQILNDFHRQVYKKPRKSALERENELLRVKDLYVQAKTKMQIAESLGFTPSYTQKCIDILINRWRDESIADIHKFKMRELAKLDKMESELWEAWFESKKGTKRKLQAKSKRPRTDRTTGVVSVSESERFEIEENTTPGNMEYMRGILAIVSKRAEIVGLYAPKKFTETDITGEKEKEAFTRDEILTKINSLISAQNPNPQPQNFVEGEIINNEIKFLEPPKDENVVESLVVENNLLAEQINEEVGDNKLPWQKFGSIEDSVPESSSAIGEVPKIVDKGLQFIEKQVGNLPQVGKILRR